MQDQDQDGVFDESNDTTVIYTAFLRTAKEALFHLFHLSCPNSSVEHRYQSTRTDFLLYALVLSLRTLQILSLIYPVDYLIQPWEQYTLWTTLVGLFRFDVAAVRLGFQSAFFYLTGALAATPVVIYLALYTRLKRKPKRGWNTLQFLFKLSIQVQAGVLFLPSCCVFLATLKYTSAQPMAEYSSFTAQVLLSPALHYFSLVALLLVIINCSLARLLIYDMFLPNAKQHIEARAHSKIEALSLACQVIAAVSHFHLQSRAYLLHYLICASLGCMMMYHYFYYLPFYSQAVNWLNFMSYFVGAWGSAALVVSDIVESASCGFVLTIVLPIAVGPVVWDMMKRRTAYISRRYISEFVTLRNMYLGELCIRFSIINYLESNPAKLDESMRDFYTATLSPLFNRHTGIYHNSMFPSLWEFGYIFSVVQDVNIARVKLTKTEMCPFDFEGAFNQYRFQQILGEDVKQTSEEAVYVSFRIQFDAAKKTDEESCHLQLLFWSELASMNPQTERAEALAFHVNQSLRTAKSQLLKLVQTYPKSHLALRLYGSYLTEVLNDTEHGRELINKSLYEESELVTRNQQMEGRFSYFDDNNGIILISASGHNIGIITYINERAGEVLGVSKRLAVGMNVAHFIPISVCPEKKHDEALLRFIRFCTSDVIQVPFGFFIQDMAEFIVDVKLQMKPTSLDLKPYFLVAIKSETAINREICLIDENGIVQTHTRGFPVLVGYSDTPILCKNLSADILLNRFSESIVSRKVNEVFSYTLPGTINQVTMKFVGIHIASTKFRLLYATIHIEEVSRWLGSGESNIEEADVGVDIKQAVAKRRKSMRSILRRRSVAPKGLKICFDLSPLVFVMPETDFPPGHSDYGKAKDAPKIDLKVEVSPRQNSEEMEFRSDVRKKTQVLDLKDLEGMMRSGRSEISDQSKVSVAILSELTEVKPKGQSMASSAMSSNSSFSSTKTAMDLLKVVNTSMKRFKYSFLLTNLVVILGVIAMLIYLIVSANTYQSRLIVQQLCDRRDLSSQLAFDARNLRLVQSGYFTQSKESGFRERMGRSLQQFDQIMQELTNLVDGFEPGEYKDLYLDDRVQIWELEAGTVKSAHENLLNVMRKLSLSGHSILETPLSLLNASHPGLYFLFQNGEGESLKVMNQSTWTFISQEQAKFSHVLQAIGIMGGMAFALLIACFVFVILPTVVAVDKSNQNIWGFFYKLPFDIVQDLRFHCEERLESTHGCDLQQFPLRKANKAELKDRMMIQCSRKWPFIFRRLWIYYFLSVAYGLYFYFVVYNNLATLLLLDPEIVNLTGQRTLAIQSSYLWLQETRLGDQDSAHTYPWSAATYWSQPQARLSSVLQQLATIELTIMASSGGTVGADSANDVISLSSVCSILSAEACGDTMLARGTHNAVLGYWLDSSYFASLPVSQSLTAELDSMHELLHNTTRILMADYSSVMSAKVSAVELQIELITTLYCVLCLVFYFVVYLPMTAQVRRQLTNIWDLASLIPTEFIERIMRALKKTEAGKAKS